MSTGANLSNHTFVLIAFAGTQVAWDAGPWDDRLGV